MTICDTNVCMIFYQGNFLNLPTYVKVGGKMNEVYVCP